jgi:hypothetical protein
MSDNRELIARAAIDAIGPLLADLQRQLADVESKAARRIADLEAEVKGLRERVALGAIPPRDGRDGKDGRDGIDATFREPVDFEAGKTFPYGAIVRHRGGLWHAHRQTDTAPEKERSGWTLIVSGINAISVSGTDDGRQLAVEIEPSAGAVIRHAFAVPVIVYRGVHNAESAYLKGDAVTHDGSLFIALNDTRAIPAQSKEWQLAVKRGQHGKDGLHGANAPTFQGFYDPRLHYPANALVRTSSGLWLTTKPTKEAPPDDPRNGESKSWRCYLPLVTH